LAKLTKRRWAAPDGTLKTAWRVDYKDGEGTRRAKQFDRKADADAYRRKVERELEDGIHLAPSASPMLAEAAESFLEGGKLRNWKTSTERQMRQHVDHIVRRIGNEPLAALTHKHVERFALELIEETSRPLAKKVLATLKSILRKAKRGHLADGVTIKSNGTRRLEVGRDIPLPAEARAIIEHSKGKWRVLNIVAIFTGLRASELRGLRWSDVDLKGGRLHVRQRADMWRELGEPKSETSERSIPIGPLVVNTLREWKLACPNGELDLVFPNASGGMLAGTKLAGYALWQPQIAAGITVPAKGKDGKPKRDAEGRPVLQAKYQGMHALRHFYASWLINRPADGGLGLDPKKVQTRLGHADIRITMNTYSHLFPSDDGAELEAGELALMQAV
jgi:integrase